MPIVKRSRRRITRRCSERGTAASRSLPPRHVFYLSIPSPEKRGGSQIAVLLFESVFVARIGERANGRIYLGIISHFDINTESRRSISRTILASSSTNDADTVYRYSVDIYPTIQAASARVLRSCGSARRLELSSSRDREIPLGPLRISKGGTKSIGSEPRGLERKRAGDRAGGPLSSVCNGANESADKERGRSHRHPRC